MDSLSENMSYDLLLRTEEIMKLKGAIDGFEDGTPEEDSTKDEDEPVTILRPSDDGCCNKYLPIYLLVHNIYLIINNDFDLLIQVSFYYHVIERLAWFSARCCNIPTYWNYC